MKSIFLLAATFLLFISSSNTQMVSTLAGGTLGYQDGYGSAARFHRPTDICVAVSGTLYVIDQDNFKIRKITPEGDVSTFAGSTSGYLDDTGTAAKFSSLTGICADAVGNLYVSEYARIRKITSGGIVTTIAGSTDDNIGFQDGNGTSARFFGLTGICVDSAGMLYAADTGNDRIRKITATGDVSTFADGTSLFLSIRGICINKTTGVLYVTDRYGHKIYKIATNGVITVFAGSGTMGYLNGVGASAQLNFPERICCDVLGNLYVTDNMYLIRKITPLRVVSTFAGAEGGNVDGSIAVARFGDLDGICVNTQGIVYVCDYQNEKIKKITPDGLGIHETTLLRKKVRIYPNPAKEFLNIETDSFDENTMVIITDVSGKTVSSEKAKGLQTTVNLERYSKGMYMATVTQGNQSVTFKFVVE